MKYDQRKVDFAIKQLKEAEKNINSDKVIKCINYNKIPLNFKYNYLLGNNRYDIQNITERISRIIKFLEENSNRIKEFERRPSETLAQKFVFDYLDVATPDEVEATQRNYFEQLGNLFKEGKYLEIVAKNFEYMWGIIKWYFGCALKVMVIMRPEILVYGTILKLKIDVLRGVLNIGENILDGAIQLPLSSLDSSKYLLGQTPIDNSVIGQHVDSFVTTRHVDSLFNFFDTSLLGEELDNISIIKANSSGSEFVSKGTEMGGMTVLMIYSGYLEGALLAVDDIEVGVGHSLWYISDWSENRDINGERWSMSSNEGNVNIIHNNLFNSMAGKGFDDKSLIKDDSMAYSVFKQASYLYNSIGSEIALSIFCPPAGAAYGAALASGQTTKDVYKSGGSSDEAMLWGTVNGLFTAVLSDFGGNLVGKAFKAKPVTGIADDLIDNGFYKKINNNLHEMKMDSPGKQILSVTDNRPIAIKIEEAKNMLRNFQKSQLDRIVPESNLDIAFNKIKILSNRSEFEAMYLKLGGNINDLAHLKGYACNGITYIPSDASVGLIVHELNHSIPYSGISESSFYREMNEAFTDYFASQITGVKNASAYIRNATALEDIDKLIKQIGYKDLSKESYYGINADDFKNFIDFIAGKGYYDEIAKAFDLSRHGATQTIRNQADITVRRLVDSFYAKIFT